ncbi:negative regulator of flagellin synthesis FlgM [Robbsia andropogonis]|uniref:flagellar biosynthesis anti-sigma factor FlgM n=2 Tax=Robbsia andropogonis TaxID=28092 RepID=UPI00209D706D|nr:flagellar biosynthesis anti-sigma factor FlgM [Robbsia andropogonis]MCP1118746.1 flagellar biosynthesis anti-sigma factor FlgM [Robbsia andropogonis]MCP1128213.1 flagellar biosynthesis anti-sigma factor FlgM [Robbsia andropogonis]
MKLNPSSAGQTPAALQKPTVGGQANLAAAPPPSPTVLASTAAASGSVSFSPMTAALLAAASDPSNDIDMPRVDELRSAIANGTLRIDAEKIADGLLVTTQELIQMPS